MPKSLSNYQLKIVVAVLLTGIAVAYALFAFAHIQDGYQQPSDRYYLFEPNTIFDSLSQGNSAAFSLQPANFSPTLLGPIKTFEWKQEDYIRIADAFYTQIWQAPIEDWRMHAMVFSMNCQFIDLGPQLAAFEIYKKSPFPFQMLGLEETIFIASASRSIEWKITGLSSRTPHKRSIDLSRLQISAIDAFQIAEQQGGQAARELVYNNCSVSAILAADNAPRGWSVNFKNLHGVPIFEIRINENTGAYEIIRP